MILLAKFLHEKPSDASRQGKQTHNPVFKQEPGNGGFPNLFLIRCLCEMRLRVF